VSENDVEVPWELTLVVFARHTNHMRGSRKMCDECAEAWPCPTYRLARIVHDVRGVLLTNVDQRGQAWWRDLSAAVWPGASEPSEEWPPPTSPPA
jgi:hypothetical protein